MTYSFDLQQLNTQSAPLSNEIAILSRQLKLDHQDPADRTRRTRS